jgi:hypothetical protein
VILRSDTREISLLVANENLSGFAVFMRGIRDGVQIDWDIAPVRSGDGLPAGHAILSRRRPSARPSS